MSLNTPKIIAAATFAAFFLMAGNAPKATAPSLDYAWDFNDEKALPPGFFNEMNATPDVLASLLRQATGASAPATAIAAAPAPRPATAGLPLPALTRAAQAGELPGSRSAQQQGR